MTPPTLAAPPRPARPPAVQGATPPSPPPAVRPRYSDTYRRILRWSLAASVAFHLLVLLLSPGILRVGLPPGDGESAIDPAAPGMRMVDPALIPSEGRVAPTPTPIPETAADLPAATVPPQTFDRPIVPRAGEPGPARAAPGAPGEARDNPLRPGLRDPRLWVPPRSELPPPPEPTQEELHARYMAHLRARLGIYNDSIAAEADRARRATDWTVRDGNGGRWGISPEGIHMGGVTLPPVQLQGDRDQELAAQEKERQRQEILRQAEDAERRKAQDESIRATRERKDAERERNTGRPPP